MAAQAMTLAVNACEHFIYSPAQEADCLPISSSDTGQLPLLSGTDTAAKSCASEPPMAGSPACTCTRETFGCSIHPNTRDEWIASQRGSLARILALPAMAQASRKVRAAVSGPKSSALLASFDRDSCSLKMSQQSFLTDSESCSPILPNWGLMRDGAVSELPMLGRLINGTDGGWLLTPIRTDSRLAFSLRDRYKRKKAHAFGSLSEQLLTLADLRPSAVFVERLMGWPPIWTVSKHWATVKSQFKRPSRGES